MNQLPKDVAYPYEIDSDAVVSTDEPFARGLGEQLVDVSPTVQSGRVQDFSQFTEFEAAPKS